ncbi:hypothetical protein QQF64_019141 [Cirrhinus molitorella]|uniref:Uncharacterized protein n=1 Tax=Cirrhinus molitorella TaxID=172907 RepID=A0ABR3LEQ5_9TELE
MVWAAERGNDKDRMLAAFDLLSWETFLRGWHRCFLETRERERDVWRRATILKDLTEPCTHEKCGLFICCVCCPPCGPLGKSSHPFPLPRGHLWFCGLPHG